MELVSPKDEFQPNFFIFYFLMRECELVGLISMELDFSRDEFQPDFFFFFNTMCAFAPE